jgi:hypothetical protein
MGTGWRPSGETIVIEQPAGTEAILLSAVPVGATPSAPVPLVAFGQSTGWDVRRDGSAVAIALATSTELSTSRIASWDPRTGTSQWVTPEEPGVLHRTPIWSADGRSIFYTALRPPDDLGIFRIGADGSRRTRLRAPEGNGAELQGLTPDGRGLVWARIQAGGSTEVLDLTTGRNSSFDPTITSFVADWRSVQPRALVITGSCCAGRARGTLVLWDDQAGTKRALYGSDLTPQEAVTAASWDPEGARIVAVVYDTTISLDVSGPLVTMNAEGGTRSTVPGTEGALDARWLRAGIVYSDGQKLRLVPAAGGAPVTVFQSGYVGAWKVVAP